MNERLLKSDFLESEILKRKFEETASLEDIEWLKDKFNGCIDANMNIEFKIRIICMAIIYYDSLIKDANPELVIKGIDEPVKSLILNIIENKELICGFYDLSKRYGVCSPYLLFPCDMESMLCNINKNKEYSEKIPLSQLFHEVRSTNELYDDYGVKFMADNNKNMIIEIHFDEKYRKQDELIDEIARQISIFKHKNGIELSKCDKIVFEKIASAEANKDLRLNSFYGRLMGILAWDMKKEDNKYTFNKIREKMIEKGVYSYKERNCACCNSSMCHQEGSCLEYITDIYKIAGMSIDKGNIVATSTRPKYSNPKEGILFKRVSPKLFIFE